MAHGGGTRPGAASGEGRWGWEQGLRSCWSRGRWRQVLKASWPPGSSHSGAVVLSPVWHVDSGWGELCSRGLWWFPLGQVVPQGSGLALSLLLCPEIQAPVPRPRPQWLPQLHHGPSGEELQPYLQPVSGNSGCLRLRGATGSSGCVLVPPLAQTQGWRSTSLRNVSVLLGWAQLVRKGCRGQGLCCRRGGCAVACR